MTQKLTTVIICQYCFFLHVVKYDFVNFIVNKFFISTFKKNFVQKITGMVIIIMQQNKVGKRGLGPELSINHVSYSARAKLSIKLGAKCVNSELVTNCLVQLLYLQSAC